MQSDQPNTNPAPGGQKPAENHEEARPKNDVPATPANGEETPGQNEGVEKKHVETPDVSHAGEKTE